MVYFYQLKNIPCFPLLQTRNLIEKNILNLIILDIEQAILPEPREMGSNEIHDKLHFYLCLFKFMFVLQSTGAALWCCGWPISSRSPLQFIEDHRPEGSRVRSSGPVGVVDERLGPEAGRPTRF